MSSLITPAELAEALAGPRPPVMLDVRWPIPGPPDRAGYTNGHIPGARFVDLDTELSAPAGGARGGGHPLPSARVFTAAMRAHGVRKSRPVVVHDLDSGLAAARAWWCLRYAGHRDVRVLDGGFTACAGREVPRLPRVSRTRWSRATSWLRPGKLPVPRRRRRCGVGEERSAARCPVRRALSR